MGGVHVISTVDKQRDDRRYLQTVRNEISEFVSQNVTPHVKVDDREGLFPRESLTALGLAGWNSILFDESLKGLGLGYTEFVIAAEEIAKADASTGLVYTMHIAASEKVYLYGTEDQKRRWLLPVRENGSITTFAISEKSTGGHVWYNLSRAVQDGDEYILNLTKSFTTSGGQADFYVTQTGTANAIELSAQSYFIVDGRHEGITAKPWDALGVRGNHSGPLTFEHVRVHKNDLLNATPEDIYQNSAAIIGLNAVWLGVAQAALDAATDHVMKTKNHGFQNTLADHQVIRAKLAKVAIRIKSSRAWLIDIARHLDELNEAGEPLNNVTAEVNECKVQVTELADFAARTAMDVAGGYGYHTGIFEKLYRDARGGIPMAPSNNIALDQIGKALVGLPPL
nr:acyl-CoA dehydrogenase family protein [Bhargavaea sp. CC-171006]